MGRVFSVAKGCMLELMRFQYAKLGRRYVYIESGTRDSPSSFDSNSSPNLRLISKW
jgi:hypothetical protein